MVAANLPIYFDLSPVTIPFVHGKQQVWLQEHARSRLPCQSLGPPPSPGRPVILGGGEPCEDITISLQRQTQRWCRLFCFLGNETALISRLLRRAVCQNSPSYA